MDDDERQQERPRERGGRGMDESPFTFSSADYRSNRDMPPLVIDRVEYELRSEVDSAVLLGVDVDSSTMMDVFEAILTEEAFEDFEDMVRDDSPPIPMLTDIAQQVTKEYRSGNRKARRERSSRSRSRR